MGVNEEYKKREPLAFRMAPRSLSEYIGQEHILGEGKMLRRMIEADRLSSIILFGPPGTGKTALARLIAHTTSAKFERINAVTAGVGDIKRIVEDAKNPILTPNGRVVLFVDEIHRFNKMQVDLSKVPVAPCTKAICKAMDIDPYRLISSGSILVATDDPEGTVKAMEEKGIQASVIGAFTEKEFVLKDTEGNKIEFLPPQTDELYKM